MRAASEYEAGVVTAHADTRVRELADEMDAQGVGSVVIVDKEGGPIGIVTDRDLVLRVIAPGTDPEQTVASDIMSTDLLVADRRTSTLDLLERLERRGVRRVPLVERGHVSGLVSLDDLVQELGVQLWNLSEAVGSEIREGRRVARARRRRERQEDALEELWHSLQSPRGEVRRRLVQRLRQMLDSVDEE